MSFGSVPVPSTNQQGTNFSQSAGAFTPPDWYTNAWQGLLGAGVDLYNNQNYTVAGLTPDQINASTLLNQGISNYMNRTQIPAYDVFGMGNNWMSGNPSVSGGVQPAQAATAQAASMRPAQMLPHDPAQFMNPYIDTALNPAVNRLTQQERERIADIAGRNAGRSMFGGSTMAVEANMADRDYRQQLAEMAGSMLKGGWDTSAQLAGQNVDRRQAANQLNAQMQNQVNLANAQMQTGVSQSNAQNAMQGAIAAGQQGGNYANLLMQTAQNDANRFLNALQLQGNLNSQDMTTLLNALTTLSNFGGQQQQTAQRGLDTYQNQINQLVNLLRAGGTSNIGPGYTQTSSTSGQTTGASQQQRPIDLASIITGGIGLASRFI